MATTYQVYAQVNGDGMILTLGAAKGTRKLAEATITTAIYDTLATGKLAHVGGKLTDRVRVETIRGHVIDYWVSQVIDANDRFRRAERQIAADALLAA